MTTIPAMTGTQLQMALLRSAKDLGWLAQMSRRSHVCRTESSSGHPDLFLAKPGAQIWIECKSKYEKVGPEQRAWCVALGFDPDAAFSQRNVGHLRQAYYLARPADYDRILADLAADRLWKDG